MASSQHIPLKERFPIAHQAYEDAVKLANEGKDYDHLTPLLLPEYFGMLTSHIQNMPDDLANRTLFGKSVKRAMPVTKNKRK